MRFNSRATNNIEAAEYIRARAKQLLRFNGKLLTLRDVIPNENVVAIFDVNGDSYLSVYLLDQFRGSGAYRRLIDSVKNIYGDLKIITVTDCNLGCYLSAQDISYICFDTNMINGKKFTEYEIISKHWDDNCAVRTGIHYMNHVDEGLRIIKEVNGSERAMRIFALHGFLQNCYADNTFNSDVLSDVAPDVLIGAMEYRAVANAHLSHHRPDTLVLSEDADVNTALIADKVQNFRDFERFHNGCHLRSKQLKQYFERWLNALDVSTTTYEAYKDILSSGDGNDVLAYKKQ